MKHRCGSYIEAVKWIAENDDNEWIEDFKNGVISVTGCLVADIFNRTHEEFTEDLKKEIKKYWKDQYKGCK